MTRGGIGRLLRKTIKGSSDEKPLSISDKINSACVNGVTSASIFSVLGIRRKIKKLLGITEDFNRDIFFMEFMDFYMTVMAPDKRAEGVFHPSQLLDGCPRLMYYDLCRLPPSDVRVSTITGELQRTFDVGTWYHVYMQAILYKIGLLEQAEVPVVNKDRYINGKADGVFKKSVFGEKVVLEIKTMNSFFYRKAIFRPFAKHEFQASLYARELGATKVLYLYINKDTSEIKDFLMPVNETELEKADEKMNTIIDCVETKTPPARICLDAHCKAALSCPYTTYCFKH